MKDILQLTIKLDHTDPLIWRRILLKKETSFFELHHIIQIVMGWKNYHLFEFNLDGFRVGMIEENENGYGSNQLLDANKTLLSDILSLVEDRFMYNYDFGDGWLHEIALEKLIETEVKRVYPICIDGQLNCPPEDCGGINGFNDILQILENKEHPRYKEIRNWVGKNYDPEQFDTVKVNKKLKQLQKYISRWRSPD